MNNLQIELSFNSFLKSYISFDYGNDVLLGESFFNKQFKIHFFLVFISPIDYSPLTFQPKRKIKIFYYHNNNKHHLSCDVYPNINPHEGFNSKKYCDIYIKRGRSLLVEKI